MGFPLLWNPLAIRRLPPPPAHAMDFHNCASIPGLVIRLQISPKDAEKTGVSDSFGSCKRLADQMQSLGRLGESSTGAGILRDLLRLPVQFYLCDRLSTCARL